VLAARAVLEVAVLGAAGLPPVARDGLAHSYNSSAPNAYLELNYNR
jgi:hypothetical protein